MDYPEAVEWLYSRQEAGVKLGLGNTRRLLRELGLPRPGAKILHVAGTNGKGSTCALAEAALRAAGHSTGLFTSPHLVSFCERLRLGGEPVAEAVAAGGIARLRALTEDWEPWPTFFELATALGLLVFAEAGCDAVVLEVGLGGRLDSTNAVTPDVCAVAPVDLDHRHILGDTLAAIATEKAGIFKPGVPAVSAPQHPEARAALEAKAAEAGCDLTFVAEPWTASPVALRGAHQRWNAALAAAALRAGGFGIGEADLAAGFGSARWPARFDVYPLGGGQTVVVDGAHNAAAARALAATWRAEFGPASRPTLVFGAAANKEIADLLAPLAALAEEIVFTRADSPRSALPEDLVKLLPPGVPPGFLHPGAAAALDFALTRRRPVLVAGSLFLAGEAIALLDHRRHRYEPSDQ